MWCGAYSRAALINFFVPDAPLIRGRRLIKGGAYSSKYDILFLFPCQFVDISFCSVTELNSYCHCHLTLYLMCIDLVLKVPFFVFHILFNIYFNSFIN